MWCGTLCIWTQDDLIIICTGPCWGSHELEGAPPSHVSSHYNFLLTISQMASQKPDYWKDSNALMHGRFLLCGGFHGSKNVLVWTDNRIVVTYISRCGAAVYREPVEPGLHSLKALHVSAGLPLDRFLSLQNCHRLYGSP